ncbi:uncharacterized protein LOC134190184 [Corticium candelabrum]|uniref:uncharacterized protein LOC134190184 n=1 Tax=Corticium candelabrum TaxID=121492 RepID=UPI002E269547|nr:uncharacterized protein LOC134190184 [Corticium candelabrum]
MTTICTLGAVLHCALLLQLVFLSSTQTDQEHVIASLLANKSISTSVWHTSLPNRWHPFSSWTSNSPPSRQYAAATELLDAKLDGTSKEVMLMYGGEGADSDHRTWLYDIQSNSWKRVRRRSGPDGIIHHTLVSLCKTRVLLFGGVSSSSDRICTNETWMFEMRQNEWKRVDATIHSLNKSFYVTPRCRHAATVVRSDDSPCGCKESMIVYSGFYHSRSTWRSSVRDGVSDVWLLKCKDDVSHVYEWILLSSSAPKLSYPALSSAFNNTIVYFYGAAVSGVTGRQRRWEVWSYRVLTATWNRHSNFSRRALHSGRILYFSNFDKSEHLLVLCCSRPFVVFDLITDVWLHPNESESAPSLMETHITVAKVGGRVIIFGRQHLSIMAPNRMWFLSMSDQNNWEYRPIKPRRSSPVKPRMSWVGGCMPQRNEILLFGGMTIDDNQVVAFDNRIHRLDLETLQWSNEIIDSGGETRLVFAVLSTATVLLDSVLVFYGGLRLTTHWLPIETILPVKDIWGYYNQETTRLLVKYATDGREPPERMLHAAAAVDSQTMIIYGGITFQIDVSGFAYASSLKLKLLYDLWSFTLPPLDEDSFNLVEQRDGSQWKVIADRKGANISYAMSLAAIDNVLYMYGGSQTVLSMNAMFSQAPGTVKVSFTCSDGMWTYNLSDSNGWMQIRYKGNGPGYRCLHQSLVFGDKIVVTGGCSNTFVARINLNTALPDIICQENSDTYGVWIYDPKSIMWLRLTSSPLYHTDILGPFSVIWNELLLSFAGLPTTPFSEGQVPDDWSGFMILRPACPPGMTSRDLEREMCYKCAVGQYSNVPNSTCTLCPHGLTTEREGCTSKTDCSRCVDDYCGYGTCTVTLLGPAPTCECQFGFTKDNEGLCMVATYYIAASGFIAGLALLILLVVSIAKFRKARKSHKDVLRNKDHELMELNSIFNIDSKELRLRGRIDQNCPGGYGEVYRAEYRELIVAVKKLQGIHQELDRIALEFEREIEVMRTMRHPNIVLFLGGGRYHDDGCLFLVVEYMPRGSLTSVLRNSRMELEDSLKMRFTIDAAKGMRFLHSLRPPRVHRDLKSSNLLVSQKWVVKVADFGSARLVKDEGIDQEAVRGAGPLDVTAPLLRADYQLSSGIGTPSWCAPEILTGQGYGTPADVYSFGIVMWEIWSRQIPFDDLTLQSVLDLKTAVLSGVRPSVPLDEHTDYVELMRACWSSDSSSRPTFCNVVVRLEGMSENCCLVSETETTFK